MKLAFSVLVISLAAIVNAKDDPVDAAASMCLVNSTCVEIYPESMVCCGVATIIDENFAYADCIPTTSSYTSTDSDGYTYDWKCIRSF